MSVIPLLLTGALATTAQPGTGHPVGGRGLGPRQPEHAPWQGTQVTLSKKFVFRDRSPGMEVFFGFVRWWFMLTKENFLGIGLWLTVTPSPAHA